jgi:hypothetical protein
VRISFAQATGAEHDALCPGRAQQAAQGDRGVGQVVQAAFGRAVHAFQSATAGGGDQVGQIAGRRGVDHIMMHHLQRVSAARHMDTGQRAPRAADQIQIAIRALGQPGNGGHVGLHDLSREVEVAVRAIREADDAQAQCLGSAAYAPIQTHDL